jgi:hypothetical protein
MAAGMWSRFGSASGGGRTYFLKISLRKMASAFACNAIDVLLLEHILSETLAGQPLSWLRCDFDAMRANPLASLLAACALSAWGSCCTRCSAMPSSIFWHWHVLRAGGAVPCHGYLPLHQGRCPAGGGESAVKLRLPFFPSFRDHYAMRPYSSFAVAVSLLSPSLADTSVDMTPKPNRVISRIAPEISVARIEAGIRKFRMPARAGYTPIMQSNHLLRTGVGT